MWKMAIKIVNFHMVELDDKTYSFFPPLFFSHACILLYDLPVLPRFWV